MADKAGFFSEQPRSRWLWQGNELLDARGDVIAVVRSDVIILGRERLLVESTAGPMQFRARATTGDGRIFTLGQAGMTVNTLIASCDGRDYTLRRRSLWRKERLISHAEGVTAIVRPLISGRVEVHDGPYSADMPTLDAVFLTWGCVLVDSPVRRPRV